MKSKKQQDYERAKKAMNCPDWTLISLRVDADSYIDFKVAACKEGFTVSEKVRQLINEYLKKGKKRG